MSTSTAPSSLLRVETPSKSDPIHEWMRIIPKALPKSKRPEDIVDELRKREFDPSFSRAIVFAMSRNNTEKLAEEIEALASSTDGWSGKIQYFHAGMTAEDRATVYERFRAGETVILCATKAFGMGMDLPNIHYVFHHQPPFSLEDYIQEIGRAGRDKSAREEAGFNTGNQIPCVLYAEPSDFAYLNDRNKSSRLAWDQLSLIQEVIHEYAARLGQTEADPESALPIPLDLLSRHRAFRDEWDPSSIQRMGFHWLEELGRIRQEYYVPAHLELANKDPETDRATSREIRKLCSHVDRVRARTGPDRERILVNTGALYNVLDINTSAALFHHLRNAQEGNHIRVFRYISARSTKQRVEIIRKAVVEVSLMPPHLELALHLAQSIISGLQHSQFFQIDSEWFTDEVQSAADDVLSPSRWQWLETEEERQELRDSVVKDLQRSARARAILFLVRNGPDVQFRRDVEGDQEIFSLRLDSASGKARARQQRYLNRQRELIRRLLVMIYNHGEQSKPIELIDTLQRLDLNSPNDIEEFEQALLFLKRMGYIKMDGGLLPMAIETYIRSKAEIDISDEQAEDYSVYQDFQQSGRLKELRLVALQVLSTLEDREDQNAFIRDYMSSEGADDVFSLLEKTLAASEEHQELLSSLREEALEKEKERLSDDQRDVYEAPLGESTLVSAGPGSGKTHTLLLRLARLIHQENVTPSQILVLAYNRAVVTEIKTRLRELFGRLGYRNLSRALRVFTFHGLIRYALGDVVDVDELDGDGDPWVDAFNEMVEDRPGRIEMRLPPDSIRYIFVDEFQDITEERYRMLSWIAGDSSRVTAIGDPDQSIYGYERARSGQARAAEPFFKRFASDFDATRYTITDNFRSLPKIVETADQFIRRNDQRVSRDDLVPRRTRPESWNPWFEYVETHEHERHAWLDKVQALLTEEGAERHRHRDVAVLFRSNAEVYRAYRLVHEQLGPLIQRDEIPVVVQGATQNWQRVREVAFCLDQIERAAVRNGTEDRFPLRASVWDQVIIPENTGFPSTWDGHTLQIVRSLIERFEREQTDEFSLTHLAEYIRDTLRRDKGQIYKLVQLHQNEEGGARPPSLVLANLHKVKGLEYDAVILPASFQSLPFPAPKENVSREEVADMIEEERRMYYVGMTRARDRLVRYEWTREECLRRGATFDLSGNAGRQLGLSIDADAFSGRVQISKCASQSFVRQSCGFRHESEYLHYIGTKIRSGDPVSLRKSGTDWYLIHKGRKTAVLSGHMSSKISSYLRRRGKSNKQLLAGLTVSDVVRYTYKDSLQYDEENSTNYSERWSSYFEGKGYTYIVNFAGYAQVKSAR